MKSIADKLSCLPKPADSLGYQQKIFLNGYQWSPPRMRTRQVFWYTQEIVDLELGLRGRTHTHTLRIIPPKLQCSPSAVWTGLALLTAMLLQKIGIIFVGFLQK